MTKLVSYCWFLWRGQMPTATTSVEPERKVHRVWGVENLSEGKSMYLIQIPQGQRGRNQTVVKGSTCGAFCVSWTE
jgi:hypothetical protein